MPTSKNDIEEKDQDFYKLFWKHFEPSLKAIANTKTELFLWIIAHARMNNILLYSYRQIADKTGISYRTVAETMKSLMETDFLCKHESGYYMINPNAIFKGTYKRRMTAWSEYHTSKQKASLTSEEKKLHEVRKKIDRLQRHEKRIEEKIERTKALKEFP